MKTLSQIFCIAAIAALTACGSSSSNSNNQARPMPTSTPNRIITPPPVYQPNPNTNDPRANDRNRNLPTQSFSAMEWESDGAVNAAQYTLTISEDGATVTIAVHTLQYRDIVETVTVTAENNKELLAGIQALMSGKLQVNHGKYDRATSQTWAKATFTPNEVNDGVIYENDYEMHGPQSIVMPTIGTPQFANLFTQILDFIRAQVNAKPAVAKPAATTTTATPTTSTTANTGTGTTTTAPVTTDNSAPSLCKDFNLVGTWKIAATNSNILTTVITESQTVKDGSHYDGKDYRSSNPEESYAYTIELNRTTCVLSNTYLTGSSPALNSYTKIVKTSAQSFDFIAVCKDGTTNCKDLAPGTFTATKQ